MTACPGMSRRCQLTYWHRTDYFQAWLRGEDWVVRSDQNGHLQIQISYNGAFNKKLFGSWQSRKSWDISTIVLIVLILYNKHLGDWLKPERRGSELANMISYSGETQSPMSSTLHFCPSLKWPILTRYLGWGNFNLILSIALLSQDIITN